MNIDRLKLISTMLGEVIAGTWKPTAGNNALSALASDSSHTPSSFTEVLFDLSEWVGVQSCGFAACAIGHACLDSRFAEQGLVLHGKGIPSYERHLNWTAVETFLEFNYSTSMVIFHPDYYGTGEIQRGIEVTPEMVKARLDFFISLSERRPDWNLSGDSLLTLCKNAGV